MAKNLTTGGSIGAGEIDFYHLSPALYSAIRNIQLHTHSGIGSVKVKIQDLDGYFTKYGFIIYSSDGTKRYQITIDNSGVLQSQQV